MNHFVFDAHSEQQTAELAAAVAQLLLPGAVVALDGPLGAGKTRFVQGIAVALGVRREEVASPTFALIHEYAGRLPIYHFDAYRIGSAAEFLDLGADEYFAGNGVALVEWAERVAACLPAEKINVRIEATGPESRRFLISGDGPDNARLLAALDAWYADRQP